VRRATRDHMATRSARFAQSTHVSESLHQTYFLFSLHFSLFLSHYSLLSPRLHILCVSPSSQVRIVPLESTARLAAFLPKINAKTALLERTTMWRGGVVLKGVNYVPPSPSTNSAARQASPHARAALSGSIRMNLDSRPVRLPPARGVHGGRSFQIVRLPSTKFVLRIV
jgi:hypothetical protein